jgi:hypothetical protein
MQAKLVTQRQQLDKQLQYQQQQTARKKSRALEFLGKLWHSVPGLPSASMWGENVAALGSLQNVLEGQKELDDNMIKSLKDKGLHLLALDESVNGLVAALHNISTRLSVDKSLTVSLQGIISAR